MSLKHDQRTKLPSRCNIHALIDCCHTGLALARKVQTYVSSGSASVSVLPFLVV